MAENDTAQLLRLDPSQFREVVRNPQTHAWILGQYRLGEHAGVVGLRRLLDEMQPEGKLHKAMEIHYHDEARHSDVFTGWMRRLGAAPPALPAEMEGFFSTSPEEFQRQRELLMQLPASARRIIVFAGINAIERGAYDQFETHLGCLERKDDIETLEQVMREERFHLSYVEAELDRQATGELAGMVTIALEQARTRFGEFQQMRRREIRSAIERILGGGGN